MTRRWLTAGIAVLAATALLAGCGGGSDEADVPDTGGGPQAAIARGEVNQEALDAVNREARDELRLRAHLVAKGAVEDDYGDLVFLPGGESCSIVVLLPTADALALYGLGTDQPVVANPSGTLGVKASSTTEDGPGCLTALSDALADLN